MLFTLVRSAAGVALLAVLAAGCGTAATEHSTAPKPTGAAYSAAPQRAAPYSPHQSPPVPARATAPPTAPTTASTQPANPIAQGNGGDHDPDNNGGPSDGDGNI